MAKSFWDAETRRSIVARVHALSPDAMPAWGTMDAPKMLSHITDSCRMAAGELVVKPTGGPLRYWPMPDLVIYTMPWPHGAPTAPELIARTVGDWTEGLRSFDAAVDGLMARTVTGNLPDHPAFGALSMAQWGALMARHLDHHLTQFRA